MNSHEIFIKIRNKMQEEQVEKIKSVSTEEFLKMLLDDQPKKAMLLNHERYIMEYGKKLYKSPNMVFMSSDEFLQFDTGMNEWMNRS